MKRRDFFKSGTLAAAGAAIGSIDFRKSEPIVAKKAKNIIFMVSDGMSTGTLNMADLYLNRITGRGSNWLQLYKDEKVSRALMDMASATSIVTDSSAASSSWGGGVRVPNNSLNVNANGEPNLPIWQKFKKAGKMVGCTTTVAITHATPAGFCVYSKSRYAQEEIAKEYRELKFDVMLGGGHKYFSAEHRKDKVDLYAEYAKTWTVVLDRDGLLAAPVDKPILGVFADDPLPYSIDHNNDASLKKSVPTLAEMTRKAIDRMKNHPKGFVLQVEGGKVDWAAHANDIGALLHDQIAFDDAIKVAMEFAEKDGNTLVIITSDHGNANPGVIYGKDANSNFDSIANYKRSNEWMLNEIKPDWSAAKVKELVESTHKMALSDEQAAHIVEYYSGLSKQEDGLYNYKKVPFKAFAEIQTKSNSVGWISMDHSADYVELAAFGPGSELIKPFMRNTDMHYLMLAAAEVENKF
jgi:alkaline phosphatase